VALKIQKICYLALYRKRLPTLINIIHSIHKTVSDHRWDGRSLTGDMYVWKDECSAGGRSSTARRAEQSGKPHIRRHLQRAQNLSGALEVGLPFKGPIS
jgi:hypothetical protein